MIKTRYSRSRTQNLHLSKWPRSTVPRYDILEKIPIPSARSVICEAFPNLPTRQKHTFSTYVGAFESAQSPISIERNFTDCVMRKLKVEVWGDNCQANFNSIGTYTYVFYQITRFWSTFNFHHFTRTWTATPLNFPLNLHPAPWTDLKSSAYITATSVYSKYVAQTF